MNKDILLYAPNVHTGGGLVLLNALLSVLPGSAPFTAFLDIRAREQLSLPVGVTVHWVASSVAGRISAEISLSRFSDSDSVVLCLHGLPPLFSSKAHIVLFLQNRNLLGLNSLSDFSFKTRTRIFIERVISKALRHRVSQFLVQTQSMKRAVIEWYGVSSCERKSDVRVMPFLNVLPDISTPAQANQLWDFVYVADGVAHKNHRILLDAWTLLANEGLRPTLVLTLGSRDKLLAEKIFQACAKSHLQVTNVGHLPHSDVLKLYGNAKALIFPSTLESFGLPLIEASHLGLPILASELDFVRDVCVPTETFDPLSAVSIARAVKRFLGVPENRLSMHTPAAFWQELLKGYSK